LLTWGQNPATHGYSSHVIGHCDSAKYHHCAVIKCLTSATSNTK